MKGASITKRRKTMKNQQQQLKPLIDSKNLFPLLLAALLRDSETLIKHCLSHLRLNLHQSLTTPILSLFPILLRSKSNEMKCLCAEMLGAASLVSLELNEKIALDGEIVRGVISLLKNAKKNVLMAACNAILDFSATVTGRQQLLEFSVIEKLILSFLQVPKSSLRMVVLFDNEEGCEPHRRLAYKNELVILFLHAAVVLVNSCSMEQLQKVPLKILESFLVNLKVIWEEVKEQILHGTFLKGSEGPCFHISSLKSNNLAESIFKLSMNSSQSRGLSVIDKLKTCMFNQKGTTFKQFLLHYWEAEPLLVRYLPNAEAKQDQVFCSFLEPIAAMEAAPSSLHSMLRQFTSCPPIASDEINVLHFLEEASDLLGSPIIYQQDIRVLKAKYAKGEQHYFKTGSGSCSSRDPYILTFDDIMNCKQAFIEGYSIALRGMEFRIESIAAVAEGLACIFGQPSAGVNLYLTPPKSQGLARHMDDHCVFVFQVFGVKQWTIYPKSSLHLPRLYQSIDSWDDGEGETDATNCYKQILLKEGDVLYIPRGICHEAQTIVHEDGSGEANPFSLHLTLAVEVEPPFEWEGFAHVALHQWHVISVQRQRPKELTFLYLENLAVGLMHIAIKLIGHVDQTFRKACLVGAISLLSGEDWLGSNQMTIFKNLISTIGIKANFFDAFKHVESAFQHGEDPFQEIRWIWNINEEQEIFESLYWSSIFAGSEDFISILSQHKGSAEAAFVQVKSQFCSEVFFEDVEKCYNMLLEKHRKVRRQYTNGMLSLHSMRSAG